jgi:hypothetical protein
MTGRKKMLRNDATSASGEANGKRGSKSGAAVVRVNDVSLSRPQ